VEKELIQKMIKNRGSEMKKLESFFEFKYFILAGIGVLTFSNFVFVLFGQTIPNIIWAFFQDVGEIVIVAAVFTFAFAWLLRSKTQKKPKNYSVVVFDVFGKESSLQGIRTEFKIHDVAWSFMKQYKKSYPLYNFALVSDNPKSDKKTIFRYI
jgi:hypothetical protein